MKLVNAAVICILIHSTEIIGSKSHQNTSHDFGPRRIQAFIDEKINSEKKSDSSDNDDRTLLITELPANKPSIIIYFNGDVEVLNNDEEHDHRYKITNAEPISNSKE